MKRSSLAARLIGWAVAGTIALAGSGCAHQNQQSQQASAAQQRIQKLQSRVEELERTNGRVMVRIDEMEDDVFLLQDRVEAHRLALRRRGRIGDADKKGRARRTQVIRAPQPTPETNYGGGNQRYGRDRAQRPQGNRRRVRTRRIDNPSNTAQRPRSNDGAQPRQQAADQTGNSQQAAARNESSRDNAASESGSNENEQGDSNSVVITEEDFRKFAAEMEQGGGDSSSSGNSKGNGRKRAKRRVTEERLATSEELNREKTPDTSTNSPSEKRRPRPTKSSAGDALDGKTGLDLYKAALAKYRGGQYSTALRGFKAFMAEGPQRDYRDNGLYWVGECYFGLGKYQRAVDHFQRVLQEQPGGNKVPDAMLKMALAHRQLGNTDKTRSLLEKLTHRYPTTNAGRLGKKKLSDLES